MSKWQDGSGAPGSSVDGWDLAASLTENRIEWLKAWLKADERKGWSGSYSDSRGGTLQIVVEGGKAWLSLSVVRGPTFHQGEIHGEFRLNGRLGWFETQPEGQDEATWITLVESRDQAGWVTLECENTSYFHGARAYFGGSYMWTGNLSPEEKNEVIKGTHQ